MLSRLMFLIYCWIYYVVTIVCSLLGIFVITYFAWDLLRIIVTGEL